MAININKVLLGGNLTRDPEVKFTASNQAICNFGVATNRRWKSPEGELKEEVTFVDCEAWGKTAEFIGKYFTKGRPIFIEGRLKLDEWTDKATNQKRSKLRVTVDNAQFVDSKPGAGGGAAGGPDDDAGGRVVTRSPARPAQPSAPQGDAPPMGEEDIPF